MRTAKTDQTGRMPGLIWVFTERTCHFVGFVKRRLIYFDASDEYACVVSVRDVFTIVTACAE